jgi:hypothetical protein
VSSFTVYRAVTGLIVPFPNSLVVGDILLFAATTRDLNKITLTSSNIDDFVTAVNTADGVIATKSQDATKVFIRCTALNNPKFDLKPCTFATKTNTPPGVYAPKEMFIAIGTVPYVSAQLAYTFTDADGSMLDWYMVSSTTASVEAIPSVAVRPLAGIEALCSVEGRLLDIQNNPVVGALVRAHIQIPPGTVDNSAIGKNFVSTISDSYGRWSLPLMQCQFVLFQIDAVGYNEIVQIPAASFALFKDLEPVDNCNFGDVV